MSINLGLTNNEDYNFSSGFHAYEDLNIVKSSDSYEYVLPYYEFDTITNCATKN